LVRYAEVRGITIVPEIDMPGHAPIGFSDLEIVSKYGNLVLCSDLEYSEGYYAAEPPAGQWNLSNPIIF
jgi:hypothetical protein